MCPPPLRAHPPSPLCGAHVGAFAVAATREALLNRTDSPNVLLVNPRFSLHSFWNYRETCELVGVRHVAAPLGLITVAALLPSAWTVRVLDCNVEDLRDDDLAWADLVMLGGMLSQQRDILQILARCQACGKPVVVGGPDVTVSPDVYSDADFRVLGEAEDVLGEFIDAWRAGKTRGTFAARGFPALAGSPLPRFDLLKLERYMNVGVQFSRGCPFNCEFCNVIELNGRTPRYKGPGQVLAELESLYRLGYRGHVDFVDDNLIGNRMAARSFLAAVASWRKRRGYPFEFSCEASLVLAEDDELLALMRAAGFFAVFIGIESPDEATLRSAQKTQNSRRDIAASVHKIYRAGMFVNAGFIVGLDGETGSVAPGMVACIESAAIPLCMVGLLYALPATQLARRLSAEGRLHAGFDRPASDASDQCTSGLNFDTLRPRREILSDYRRILNSIYEPAAFFGRVRRMARALRLARPGARSSLRVLARNLRSFARISARIGIRDRQTRGPYWRAVADCLAHNPGAIRAVVSLAALYLHVQPFSRYLERRLSGQCEAGNDAPTFVELPPKASQPAASLGRSSSRPDRRWA